MTVGAATRDVLCAIALAAAAAAAWRVADGAAAGDANAADVWAALENTAAPTLRGDYGCLLFNDTDVTKSTARLSLRVTNKTTALLKARKLIRHAHGEKVTTVGALAKRFSPEAMHRVAAAAGRVADAHRAEIYVDSGSPGEIVRAFKRPGRCPRITLYLHNNPSATTRAAAYGAQQRYGKDRLSVIIVSPGAIIPV